MNDSSLGKLAASIRESVSDLVEKGRTTIELKKICENLPGKMSELIATAKSQAEVYERAKAYIQQQIQDTEKWADTLKGMLDQVKILEKNWIRKELYSEHWYRQERQNLQKVFQDDPQAGFVSWLQTYVGALLAWKLDICEKLVQEPFPYPPESLPAVTLFKKGTQGLKEENYPEALEMLNYLGGTQYRDQSQPLLDEFSRALVHILMGRIFLGGQNHTQALKHFEQAAAATPGDGRPLAALSNAYLVQKDLERALTLAQQAMERSPDQPDGYVGMALWAEEKEKWDEVDGWYDRAIGTVSEEEDISAALSGLLAPVSGKLFFQVARFLEKQNPEKALLAVDLAIDRGILDEGVYPERLGYRLKGKILQTLQRPLEAAEAFYEAGRRYAWMSENRVAEELLSLANRLNPEHQPTYWEWADAVRMSSYQPHPPYVDGTLLEESRKIWEKGARLGTPDSAQSWAYVSRANISGEQTRLPQVDQEDLLWEAITFLERGILLAPSEPYRWAYLGRYYHNLMVEDNSLHAASKAMEYGPEDPVCQEECAAILADRGEFDEAGKLIDHRLEQQSNPWAHALKSYILVFQGQAQAALTLIDEVIKEVPEDIWYREVRTLCYRRLKDLSGAMKDFQYIWDKYDPEDRNNLLSFGWAGYNLGTISGNLSQINQAIEIFEGLSGDPLQSAFGISLDLGMAHLARGNDELNDLERGEALLLEALLQATNARQLDEWLEFDLPGMQTVSEKWPHGVRVREIISQLKRKIKKRRREVKNDVPRPFEELKHLIEKLEARGKTTGWLWVSAHAGLARQAGELSLWWEAAISYCLLGKDANFFPEFRLGLEAALERLQEEADDWCREARTQEAMVQYHKVLELMHEASPVDTQRRADLYGRLGYAAFASGNSAEARQHFIQALEIYQGLQTGSPGESLGQVCHSLLTDSVAYWNLESEWQVLEQDPETGEKLRLELASARNVLSSYLDEIYLPFVRPIVVEIGKGFILEEPAEEWPLTKHYLPEMRDRINEDMGVPLPGTHLRGNEEGLSPDAYLIFLDEIPLVMGQVQTGWRYCPASPDQLETLKIPKENLKEAPNPLTGDPGCWIHPSNWEKVQDNGIELWPGTEVFMVYHLEAVLRRNLGNFLGIQEVENLLEAWGQDEAGASLIRSALSHQMARRRFGYLLCALVKEGVPITPWQDILEVVQSMGLASDDIKEALGAVRQRVKKLIPGNRPGMRRLELPASVEEKLAPWITHQNNKSFLAMPPEEVKEFLSAVHELVDPQTKHTALVTMSADFRPLVQNLIGLEFPDLQVLSQNELLSSEEVGENASAKATEA